MPFSIDKPKTFFNSSSIEGAQVVQQSNMTKVEDLKVSEPSATISERINDFGFEWYRKTEKEGNTLVSAISAFTALSMAYFGAKGETAEEMKKVLHMPDSNVELAKYLSILVSSLTHNDILSISNNVFASKNCLMFPSFLEEMETIFKATPENVNFADRSTTAAYINSWVAKKTNGKIKDLLDPDMLSEDTSAVLINAIYLLANWKTAFDPFKTYDCKFYVDQDMAVEVPMMHECDDYVYFENESMKMVRFAYEEADKRQRNLGMYIILPQEGVALESLESNLSAKLFNDWKNAARSCLVNVAMPKFEFEDKSSLKNDLINMGMQDAFCKKADFSGMMQNSMHIEDVLQKTYIKVDEKGTEAAAATAVLSVTESACFDSRIPKEFKVDRPFMLLIVDDVSDCVLFTGRVTNPLG